MVPLEFVINPSSNKSYDPMSADCKILTSIFNDSNKIISKPSLIGSRLPKAEKLKKISKLQKLKDLGLLGAIKKSEITSENYKQYFEEYFE